MTIGSALNFFIEDFIWKLKWKLLGKKGEGSGPDLGAIGIKAASNIGL